MIIWKNYTKNVAGSIFAQACHSDSDSDEEDDPESDDELEVDDEEEDPEEPEVDGGLRLCMAALSSFAGNRDSRE